MRLPERDEHHYLPLIEGFPGACLGKRFRYRPGCIRCGVAPLCRYMVTARMVAPELPSQRSEAVIDGPGGGYPLCMLPTTGMPVRRSRYAERPITRVSS